MNNAHPVIAILDDLIRIQSVNPYFGNGAHGEGEVATYLEERWRRQGLSVRRQRVLPGRDNILVEVRVGRPESALLLEAHMDTVTLGSMRDPLIPVYRDGRIYGRGACDTKGSLAAMVYAIEQCAMHPERLASDVILCASVDEEHAYRGLMALLEDDDVTFAGAVVGEPTNNDIVTAHKGCARFAVETIGVAAHSSMPEQGVSAIYGMMNVLDYIRTVEEPRLRSIHHPSVGSPTISVGTIQGGLQINIVPESCRIEVDRRINPGEQPEAVIEAFRTSLTAALAKTGTRFRVEELLIDWALDTDPCAAIVKCASSAAKALGLRGEPIGAPYGTDASKIGHFRGVPSIVFGPGSIAQAHTSEEWVPEHEVVQAAEFYWKLAQTFHASYHLEGER